MLYLKNLHLVSLWKLYRTDPAWHPNIEHQRKRNRGKPEGVNPGDKNTSVVPSFNLSAVPWVVLHLYRIFSLVFVGWGCPQGFTLLVQSFFMLTPNCSCSGVSGRCGVFHEYLSNFISICASPCLYFCFSPAGETFLQATMIIISDFFLIIISDFFLNLQKLDFSVNRDPATPWKRKKLMRKHFCALCKTLFWMQDLPWAAKNPKL